MQVYNQSTTMALSLLCFIKRSKANTSERVPLYLRISIDNERVELSLKRFINPLQWDSKRQIIKGRTEEAKTLNEYIKAIKLRLYNHYNSLLTKGEVLTASKLKQSFLGKDDAEKFVLQVFEYHNQRQQQQVGKGVAKGTCQRYKICKKHIEDFIRWKFNNNDIPLSLISYEVVADLEFYFRTIRKCNNNTALKYISNFKKIINLARKHGWLKHDPFIGFNSKLEAVDRGYLTEDEVFAIARKEFSIQRLNTVRDIFVFSCFTGLSYSDVQKLTPDHVIIGIDGSKWINVERTKTSVTSKIPLLPLAENLIQKYKDHPENKSKGKLLPVISNQKMNAYLKEIADVCGINKHLTFHVSRHTFATSITLTNKVPIESVSKMLGHKSIKTTQIYSRVLDKKISEDMISLKERYRKDSIVDLTNPINTPLETKTRSHAS